MKNVICPACGAEFEPKTEPMKIGTWTEQEDTEILARYKNRERILEIADKLNRTPRRCTKQIIHIKKQRGAGKCYGFPRGVRI